MRHPNYRVNQQVQYYEFKNTYFKYLRMQKRGNLLKKQITSLKAESEGFKPPVRTSRTADFESAPIDHSGNFPLQKRWALP